MISLMGSLLESTCSLRQVNVWVGRYSEEGKSKIHTKTYHLFLIFNVARTSLVSHSSVIHASLIIFYVVSSFIDAVVRQNNPVFGAAVRVICRCEKLNNQNYRIMTWILFFAIVNHLSMPDDTHNGRWCFALLPRWCRHHHARHHDWPRIEECFKFRIGVSCFRQPDASELPG